MPFGRVIQKTTPQLFAGRLRHKIALANITNVQDSMGGSDQSCDVVWAEIPASIEALSGTEKFAAHEFISQASHQVVIRYIGASPSWQAGQAIRLGQMVIDSNGNWQQAQGNGVTGQLAPTWNQSEGGYTDDGSGSLAFRWYSLGPPPPSTGVTASMVVLFQNRQFMIEAVLNPDERNKMLILLCIEINGSQYFRNVSYPGDLY